MKFAANLSTMFSNMSMIKKYETAAQLGFKAVETQFLDECEENQPHLLAQALKKAKLQHVLLNSYPGADGECGFTSSPQDEERFYESVSKVLPFTFSLNIKKIHILSGITPDTEDKQYVDGIFIQRLKSISEVLEEHGIIGLIEPLSPSVKENYFLSSFTQAIRMLDEINCPNIKLLLDVFHLQEIEGSVENLEKYFKYAGHIQVSQSPGRTELDSAGTIDYRDVLSRINTLGYDDYVGLEYFPTRSAEESLEWIKKFGYSL